MMLGLVKFPIFRINLTAQTEKFDVLCCSWAKAVLIFSEI